MRSLHRLVVAGLVALAGCSDTLDVVNDNSPDKDRALARPSDVELLIAGSYNTMHRATFGANNLIPQIVTAGMENYSALNNFSMNQRAALPSRPPIENFRGHNAAAIQYNEFLGMHRAARAAAIGLNRVNDPGFTFFPTNLAQNERAKAFGHFVIGVALGVAAMEYDSGSTVNENDDLTSNAPLAFVSYDSLAKYAISKLDSAIAHAATMLAVPSSWVGNAAGLTAPQFIAYARGWRARIRAQVARDPAERAAVAWDSVILDATAFTAAFPADYVMALNPANGWDNQWITIQFNNGSVNWHMMMHYIIGMADSSGQYDAWLATPAASRAVHPIVTADRRMPAGVTEAAQEASTGPFQYIQNRTSGDWSGDPTGNSQYRHVRFFGLVATARVGNFPTMTTAELNMLAAEGHIRNGNFDAAAALINITRVARGALPQLPLGMTANTMVPGNDGNPGTTGCVPRIPVGPAFTSTQCGNMLEAMKWEMRMETAYAGYGTWFFNGRGWGDLPSGTAVHWPVPYQEMDARRQAYYPMSGPGTIGTYGL